MIADDFKHLHRLEIIIRADHDWQSHGGDDPVWAENPEWVATWYTLDDKACDRGHTHRKYRTMKNKDLLQLMELIKESDDKN